MQQHHIFSFFYLPSVLMETVALPVLYFNECKISYVIKVPLLIPPRVLTLYEC
jgi:hypothetical protein